MSADRAVYRIELIGWKHNRREGVSASSCPRIDALCLPCIVPATSTAATIAAVACAATTQHQEQRKEDQNILEHCFPPTPATKPTLQYRMVALGLSYIRWSASNPLDRHCQ